MKLTRIVAAGAVALGLLAVAPAAAMASTSGTPAPISVRCPPPPPRLAAGISWGTVAVASPSAMPGPGGWIVCCAIVKRPGTVAHPGVCPGRTLVFDMPAYGRTAYEVSGPRLHAHEAIFFRGRIFMVESVQGRAFTLDFRGSPYVNQGPRIRDGRALVLLVIRVAWKPVK